MLFMQFASNFLHVQGMKKLAEFDLVELNMLA